MAGRAGILRACRKSHLASRLAPLFDHPPIPLRAPLVELRQATKVFGATVALWRVDLQIWHGEAVGLVGGNGSGKSTLLRAVAGTVELDGGRRDVVGAPRISLLGHRSGLVDDLTVRENLRLFSRSGRRRHRSDLIASLRLHDVEHARVSSLSAGTRRRAGLARALVADPDLLVLDEPFASVDAEHASAVVAVLNEWRAGGGSLLVAAHDAASLAPLCDRLHRLTHGRLVAAVERLATVGEGRP